MTTEHGTDTRYNQGCRCSNCRSAHADAGRAYRQRLRERVAAGKATIPHGTTHAYVNYGCRCATCCELWSQYMRGRRRPAPVSILDTEASA